MTAKTTFESEAEKKAYVLECDADFEHRLDRMMKDICDIPDIDFITLSGPTCSGKTTASKKLISEYSKITEQALKSVCLAVSHLGTRLVD